MLKEAKKPYQSANCCQDVPGSFEHIRATIGVLPEFIEPLDCAVRSSLKHPPVRFSARWRWREGELLQWAWGVTLNLSIQWGENHKLHRWAPRLDSEIKLRERALHLGVWIFSGLVGQDPRWCWWGSCGVKSVFQDWKEMETHVYFLFSLLDFRMLNPTNNYISSFLAFKHRFTVSRIGTGLGSTGDMIGSQC